ncbi:MAG: ribose-phosphate pyrophosphokinase [Clostridia bacterium]|nr:ribose-phosphate pyrophosphokinase [Clostridia bacterium]
MILNSQQETRKDRSNYRGKDIMIFSGDAHPKFAQAIADELGTTLAQSEMGRFADGEVKVRINTSARGYDCYVVQPTCAPVNDNLMGLLVMIDALKRASAFRITAVIPYFGYARQDRKAKPHDPISAKLVADLLTAAGADRILTMDLHALQIQGFFNIPVDHLIGAPLITSCFLDELNINPQDYVCLSPDMGSVTRVRTYAENLGGLPIAIANKNRYDANKCEVLNIIGDVKDKKVLLLDDMIDTAGTLCGAANLAMQMGAASVTAAATHGVLSGEAIARINESCIDKLYLLDTINIPQEKLTACPKIEVLSCAKFFAEAIKYIHQDEPLTDLITKYYHEKVVHLDPAESTR